MNISRVGIVVVSAVGSVTSMSAFGQALPGYTQTNLVSNLAGEAAIQDTRLINPWGIAESAGSPFWISDNGGGQSTVYNTAGTPQAPFANIGTPTGGTGAPTGIVFSGTAGMFNGDSFLFDTEDGTLYGWRGALGNTAELLQNNSDNGSAYKGLAIAAVSGNVYAYGANFTNGRIDVFPGAAGAPALSGNFTDPSIPAGYGPFNIQNLGGKLYVTYAQQSGGLDEVDGPGLGAVSIFDTSGNLLQSLIPVGGVLNAPWGMAIAPASFGPAGGDLLVGNFGGDSLIDAFNPTTGALVGTLADTSGTPISNEGLWGLQFGNGGNGGLANSLYITVGLNDEANGLFARIDFPEPAPVLLLSAFPLVLRRRSTRLS